MRGAGAPWAQTEGATNTRTTAFTGGAWTFTRTAQASAAETIARFTVSDVTTSTTYAEIGNLSATDGAFSPYLLGVSTTSLAGLSLYAQSPSGGDTGSTGLMNFVSRIGGATAVTTRPTHNWFNAGNLVLSLLPLNSGANSCLLWGTQALAAPAFINRSNGTRLVLYNNIGAASMDYAIGAESGYLWSAVGAANNSFGHKWYAGITQLALLRGDGVLNLGTNTTLYSRLGQKLETNTSANYGGAALNTWSASAAETSILDFNRSKSATIGTHSVVASGDGLGSIFFRGSDGTAFINAGQIRCESDGTPGTNDMPGRLMFLTTPDGSTTLTERMRIDNAGTVSTTGSRVMKLRVATTTPVTVVQGSDEVIVVQLAAPGAVAVNLPATPATGLQYVIKDGTGDAAANNITVSPAAGNIDGAATSVISTNYGSRRFIYNGTQWNVI